MTPTRRKKLSMQKEHSKKASILGASLDVKERKKADKAFLKTERG